MRQFDSLPNFSVTTSGTQSLTNKNNLRLQTPETMTPTEQIKAQDIINQKQNKSCDGAERTGNPDTSVSPPLQKTPEPYQFQPKQSLNPA